MSSPRTPPGWPQSVPPPESPGWQVPAVSWLLDHCPADYRGYAGWRKNPVALAWVAVRHIDAQLEAMRQAYREAVSYTHLRAHETGRNLVCRLLLEKKKKKHKKNKKKKKTKQ